VCQKLSENIADCIAHAVEAQGRANESMDPATKREFAASANRWRRLAESYQFLERIGSSYNAKASAVRSRIPHGP
jgi:hypothetical protein